MLVSKVIFVNVSFTALTSNLLTARTTDEFLPGRGGVRVRPQHVRGLQQEDGGLLNPVQCRGHVLLQDLVFTVVDRFIANL